MAILINTSTVSEITVNQAYARIDSLVGNKTSLTIYVNFYVTAEAANSGIPSFKQSSYEFTPNSSEGSERWDKQAYEYIKTLPEFEGAIDA